MNKPALRHGLIVGGMADGVVNVWDAATLVGGAPDGGAVAMIERHSAAVRAVQFNPHPAAQHLIGAASIDGDISIINLESPGAPTVASPMAGGQRLEAEISSLAWNTSVSHILATATLAGVVVVWDLKENKPWCQLRDPHRAAIADVAWAPNDGLYLVTACDDDSRPVLRLWDLRSSTTTPLAEFAGHTKGILSVDWCPHDPNLLLSCGKDGRTFVWDILQGRAIAEVPPALGDGATPRPPPAGHNAFGGGGRGGGIHDGAPFGGPPPSQGGAAGSVFGAPPSAASHFGGPVVDAGAVFGGGGGGGIGGGGAGRRYAVRWSKHLPAIFAAASLDRRVTVHSVAATGPALTARSAYPGAAGQAAALEATLCRAPRWLRRPASAAFGFGGRLLTFGAPSAAVRADLRVGPISYPKTVNISTVCLDHAFVSAALSFEAALAQIEAGATDPRAFCENRAAAARAAGAPASVAAVWSVMRLLFEENQRAHILAYLGYDPARIAAEVATYAGPANCVLPVGAQAPAGDASTADPQQQQQQHQQQHEAPVDAGQAATSATPASAISPSASRSHISGGAFSSSGAWGPSAEDIFSSSVAPPGDAPVASSPSSASPPHGIIDGHASAAGVFSGGGGASPSNGGGAFAASASHIKLAQTSTASSTSSALGGKPSEAPSGAGPSDAAQQSRDGASFVQRRVPTAADDAMLKRALLVGDFSAAVAAALKAERTDDALLLAGLGPSGLWAATQVSSRMLHVLESASTAHNPQRPSHPHYCHACDLQEEIFRRRASPLMTIMSAVIKGDLGALVSSSTPREWRETLALLCTYAPPTGFASLAEALGDRLHAAGTSDADAADAAVIAYMCAGAVDKTLQIWAQEAREAADHDGSGAALQELTERATIFRRAVALASGGAGGDRSPENAAAVEYASMLANEGYLATAATFAARIQDPPPPSDGSAPPLSDLMGALLRDRLARAFSRADYASPAVQAVSAAPFPLYVYNIGPAPAPPTPSQSVGAPQTYAAAAEPQQLQQPQHQLAGVSFPAPAYDTYGNPVAPVTAGYNGSTPTNAGAAFSGGAPASARAGAYAMPPQNSRGMQQLQLQQVQQQQQPVVSARGVGAGMINSAAPVPQQQHQQAYGSTNFGGAASAFPAAQAAPSAAPVYQQQQQQPPQQAYGGWQQQQQQPLSARGVPPLPVMQPGGPVTLPSAGGSYGGGVSPPAYAPPQPSPPQQQPHIFNPAAAQPQQPPTHYGGPHGGNAAAGGPRVVNTFTPQSTHMPPQLAPAAQPSMAYGAPPPAAPVQAPAPAPPPAPLPVSPEMDAALAGLNGTVSALGGLQLNAMETRQLQEASAALALIRVRMER